MKLRGKEGLLFIFIIIWSYSPKGLPEESQQHYKISEAKLLNQVLTIVLEDYINPEKIKPYEMLISALKYMQIKIPSLFVKINDKDPKDTLINISIGDKEFSITVENEKLTPWRFSNIMQKIFAFIEKNFKETEEIKLKDIEYIAINGILHTLDPHSVLMTKESLEEMEIDTRGEFGGLGIIISKHPDPPCSGRLTVMEVLPFTPASKVGLKPMDQILEIDGESSDCMELDEAVSRMRGVPGTSVKIKVIRAGWKKPKEYQIIRDIIHVDSVKSELLPGGIGYVKINSFQSNTDEDLKKHLQILKEKGMKALILDLRDNPGGLLSQAENVSNLFLEGGTIVVTASNKSKEKEVLNATPKDTEPFYPVVVLVNNNSASASEIVSGALQLHNRALVVGSKTFGKGSVQYLYNLWDGSALKLTIAEYLIAGRLSIQSTGVIPDMTVHTIKVEKGIVDIEPNEPFLSEKDLELVEENHNKNYLRKLPELSLGIYVPYNEGEEIVCNKKGECNVKPEEKLDKALVEVIRLFLAGLDSYVDVDRLALFQAMKEFVQKFEEEQSLLIAKKLKEFNIDWSKKGRDSKNNSSIEVEITTKGMIAGKKGEIIVTVKNIGENPIYRLRAYTDSENYLFKGLEFVFGKLEPGESRSWKREICISQLTVPREDPVEFIFKDDSGKVIKTVSKSISVEKGDEINYAFGYRWSDKEGGDGDGIIEAGEKIRLEFALKNIGTTTTNTIITCHNKNLKEVKIDKCYFSSGELKAGSMKKFSMNLDIKKETKENNIGVELFLQDNLGRAYKSYNLYLPLNLKRDVKNENYLIIEPPEIKLEGEPPLSTTLDNINLKGEVSSQYGIKDIMIFVDENKLFYKEGEGKNNIKFDVTLDLHEGSNRIVIVARDINKFSEKKIYYVRRNEKDGTSLPSPKLRWDLLNLLP